MRPYCHLFAALSLLALAACQKSSPSSADTKPPAPTPEPVRPTAPAPPPAPTPAPAPVAVTPTAELLPVKMEPTPPPKVFAPEGTLFAVERISVTTNDGVFTVPAGSRLKIVRKEGDGYIVKDNQHQFAVEAHQVTNEMGEAGAAAQHHLAEQAAIAEAARTQTAAQLEARRLQGVQDAADARVADKEKRRAALEALSFKLAGEIAALRTRIDQGYSETSRAYYPGYNRVGTSTVDPAIRAGWERRLAEAEEQKRQSDAELNRLRYQSTAGQRRDN